MQHAESWSDPVTHITRMAPDAPVLYFSPDRLQATARAFRAGFPGLVSYAVKANPGEEVLANLVAAGITAFDVASPAEMHAVRAVSGTARCCITTTRCAAPPRWPRRCGSACAPGRWIARASSTSSRAWCRETARSACGWRCRWRGRPMISGRNSGGARPAAALLREVAARGFTPSLTFHPGTQCADPAPGAPMSRRRPMVARAAGVRLARLNVGGGFAAHRTGAAPDLGAMFDHIGAEVARHFPADPPRSSASRGARWWPRRSRSGCASRRCARRGGVSQRRGLWRADRGARHRRARPHPRDRARRHRAARRAGAAWSSGRPATASTGCPTRCRCRATWRRAITCSSPGWAPTRAA